MKRTLLLAVSLAVLAGGTRSARATPFAENALLWTFGAGVFDVAAPNDTEETELTIEVRGKPTRLGFLPERFAVKPVAGVALTSEDGYWIFGGFRYDWQLAPRWIVSPGFAVSFYERGEGKNLGGALEFRSYIEIARQLDERFRIGLALHHLSNAGLYRLNPGSESLLLTLSAPLESLWR